MWENSARVLTTLLLSKSERLKLRSGSWSKMNQDDQSGSVLPYLADWCQCCFGALITLSCCEDSGRMLIRS